MPLKFSHNGHGNVRTRGKLFTPSTLYTGLTVIVLHGPISGSKLFETDGIPDFLGKKTILKKNQQMNNSMKNYPAYRVKQVCIHSLTQINCGSLNLFMNCIFSLMCKCVCGEVLQINLRKVFSCSVLLLLLILFQFNLGIIYI